MDLARNDEEEHHRTLDCTNGNSVSDQIFVPSDDNWRTVDLHEILDQVLDIFDSTRDFIVNVNDISPDFQDDRHQESMSPSRADRPPASTRQDAGIRTCYDSVSRIKQ